MKKLLIASIVASSAAGSAMAQSVTVYGIIDAYVGTYKDTLSAKPTSSTTQTVVNSAGLKNNRLGFKGSEVLSSDLTANFQLEQGFNSDDGTAFNSITFNRQSWVGLSSVKFGEVRVGRTYTVYDAARVATDTTANYNLSPVSDVFKASGGDYTSSVPNQIQYLSPSYNGFKGALSIGFGENSNSTGNVGQSSTNVMSANVSYTHGPVMVIVAHQTEQQLAGVSSSNYNLVGGSYDFGKVKLSGAYNKVDRAANSNDREYQIGATVPMGTTTLYVGYANASTTVAGKETVQAHGYDLVATYSFSKTTMVYTGFKKVVENNPSSEFGSKSQAVIGMTKYF